MATLSERLEIMQMVQELSVPLPVPSVEDEAQRRRMDLKRSLGDMCSVAIIDDMVDDTPVGSPTKRQRVDSGDDGDNCPVSGKFRLTDEQEEIVQLALKGASFYFTGKAGTGKSFTVRAIAERLRDKYHTDDPKDCPVHITATTGKVAGDLCARTINNFMAFGTGEDAVPKLVRKIRRAKKQCEVIGKTRVLIIDEISMMSAEIMDKLSEVLGKIVPQNNQQRGQRQRKSKKDTAVKVEPPTFGGIQMIVCGDFHQLPPVGKKGKPQVKLCFESATWNRTFGTTRMLTRVFRQACDPSYASIVDEVREGYLSPHSRSLLESRLRRGVEPGPDENGIIPTVFFPRRDPVHQMNSRQLMRLPGEKHVFECKDWAKTPKEQGHEGIRNLKWELDSICRAPKELELKVDAQVVLLKNIDQENRLCNGLRGVVVGFQENEKGYPIVRFQTGITRVITPESWKIEEGYYLVATRTQIPLMLGWASTVHGGQGETCSLCALNLDGCFERGMAYVQFSRATSLKGMSLDRIPHNNELTPDPRAADFWRRITQAHYDRLSGKCVGPVYATPQKPTGTLGDYFERTGMTRSR